jgi:DNA-3-methyladenine glycosylase I
MRLKQPPKFDESSPFLKAYHETNWGHEQHDDQVLFEMLSLQTYQIGLRFETVLEKKSAFEKAFFQYDIKKVAQMMDDDIERLMQDQTIIRNHRKLAATVKNAQAIVTLQRNGQTFDDYLWSFVNYQTVNLGKRPPEGRPVESDLSEKLALRMKKDGFTLVGPVTLFTYMLSIKMIEFES